VKARCAVQSQAANEEKSQGGGGQNEGRGPVELELREAGGGGEVGEDGGGGGYEQPVDGGARRFCFAGGLAAVHAGFDVIAFDVVTLAFAVGGLLPLCLLGTCC